MAEKVLDFSKEYAATDPGYAGVVTRLEETLTRAMNLAQEAVDTTEGELFAVHRRTAARRRIQQQLRHLAGAANAAARELPGLDEQLRAPTFNRPNREFLAKARISLERATEHQELLLKYALGENFIAELTASITEFDEMGGDANLDRVIHVGARRDLRIATAECMELIGALDGFNRARFANDARLLGAWEAARNTYGPIKKTPKPDGDVVGEIPQTPQDGPSQPLLAPPAEEAAA